MTKTRNTPTHKKKKKRKFIFTTFQRRRRKGNTTDRPPDLRRAYRRFGATPSTGPSLPVGPASGAVTCRRRPTETIATEVWRT